MNLKNTTQLYYNVQVYYKVNYKTFIHKVIYNADQEVSSVSFCIDIGV